MTPLERLQQLYRTATRTPAVLGDLDTVLLGAGLIDLSPMGYITITPAGQKVLTNVRVTINIQSSTHGRTRT